jgi:hypothetical protein
MHGQHRPAGLQEPLNPGDCRSSALGDTWLPRRPAAASPRRSRRAYEPIHALALPGSDLAEVSACLDSGMVTPGGHCGHVVEHLLFDVLL